MQIQLIKYGLNDTKRIKKKQVLLMLLMWMQQYGINEYVLKNINDCDEIDTKSISDYKEDKKGYTIEEKHLFV